MVRDISPRGPRGRIEPKAAETELRMWQWSRAEGEQRLVTHGLGPCIGVGILNLSQKVGYLGHFPAATENSAFTDMATLASDEQQTSDELRGWVAGGLLIPNSFEAAVTQANRELVVSTLYEIVDVMEIEWSVDRHYSQSMVVDIGHATCEIMSELDIDI